MGNAPDALLRLIDRFDQDRKVFLSGEYKEEQLRLEFLNPFFTALGWDMDNRQGLSETFKQVIHEETLRVAGASKAPDYTFRIGGRRTFFVEAKKPAVNVAMDSAPAFQLRRYAWTARLPVSILSDFEEFAVYDCRLRPFKTDKPTTARTMLLGFQDYAARWDELSGLFSPDAIQRGALERYVESTKTKKGTTAVDDAFLEEISRWREMLAKNIALRNPRLSTRELNFAVQRTIDRLIFLRICEDRGIESYAYLQSLLNGERVYARLLKHFRDADDKYNSGLFHFSEEKGFAEPPDKLSLDIDIDDKPLKDIIGNLYYPDSPYEFSVMPADVLGQVYEQFLGKVIRLTAGHQAKVEEKPEVRKAGGVYYTPTYIVDYIVKNTVGKLLEGDSGPNPRTPGPLNPEQASRLRILDPACGSGSFLLGAYQYLLDWHLDWYQSHKPQATSSKQQVPLYQDSTGTWKLTTAERKRILLNNIYGVDIDSQAVEVTKLSLLLKVLEGENQETLGSQLKLYHERALPDLGSNIKCGNSLISHDVFKGQQAELFDNEELRDAVNAFDWQDGFPVIMKAGGFDAVIGNPPYFNVDGTWGHGDLRLAALRTQYPDIYNDKTDILFYFLGRAVSLSRGFVAFIVSRAFLEAYKANKLRAYLLKQSFVREFVDFRNYYVFSGIGITTGVLTLQKNVQPGKVKSFRMLADELSFSELSLCLQDPQCFEAVDVVQSSLDSSPWVFASSGLRILDAKIDKAGQPVGDVLAIGQGMQTGRNDVFGERTGAEVLKWRLSRGSFYKRATNTDIRRYNIDDRREYILYVEDAPEFESLPQGVRRHLEAHADELKARAAYKRGNCLWWRYTWPLHREWYNRPRILCPYLASENRFALDLDRQYLGLTDTTVLFDNGQTENLRFFLGLLNSKLLTYRFRSIGKLKSGGILEYFWNSVSKLPVRRIDFTSKADRAKHDEMVGMVETTLKLHKDLPKAKTPHEQESLQRQIAATDKQIDALVYELYGLTKEEITIVEAART